ncbi:MAG: Fur family transcriptional regulator [Pseudomonadota bacterium]
MIVEALQRAGRPVSAYEIIDRLRDRAVLAPQTVYRALDRLIAQGQAHRLESLNAFVACCQIGHHGAAVFAICEGCGAVTEFDEPKAIERLAGWADRNDFAVRQMTLELRGRCAACRAAG